MPWGHHFLLPHPLQLSSAPFPSLDANAILHLYFHHHLFSVPVKVATQQISLLRCSLIPSLNGSESLHNPDCGDKIGRKE